jgi:tetratricopeptide (TPR) repeat protein
MDRRYASCDCGSGKAFKFCCEPIYGDIQRAYEQDDLGQHDTAVRIMDEVTSKHPKNPQAWGMKAKLLAQHGKVEQAEAALEEAFKLNAEYPFGLLLRANFRFAEGEYAGALLLARRSAEAYAPDATDALGEVYAIIHDCETRMHRPVAARAALKLVMRFKPDVEETQQLWDSRYGPGGALPEAVRKEYSLRSPVKDDPKRRAAWDRALASARGPRLGELVKVFEQLTAEDAEDVSAWFNLGLARAWQGDNRGALEALDRSLERETDDAKAEEAATLQEVLRMGRGLEEICDYREYAFVHQFQDPAPVGEMLKEWVQSYRLLPLPQREDGHFAGMLLETTAPGLITVGSPPTDEARLAGYIAIVGPVIRIWGPRQETIERLRDECRQKLSMVVGEGQVDVQPGNYVDVPADAILFPARPEAKLTKERLIEHAQKFYEDTWPHQPRRSLSSNSPMDAVGSPVLRRKLLGVVRFLQDCAALGILKEYDFDRLRSRLGLNAGGAGQAAAGGVPQNFSVLSSAELGALAQAELTPDQLEQAFQAALKLDAQELAQHFARKLVALPGEAGKPDRYPWYSYLLQRSLLEGQLDDALNMVDEGERVDCERNGGQRRNDYELQRGKVHVRRKEGEQARDVFRSLLDRVPSDVGYRTAATEAMLSLKRGPDALRFAEEGVADARKRNDRGSEEHFQELMAAAKKLG